MSIIKEKYELQNYTEYDFREGSQPSTITHQSITGGASINYNSSAGGRMVLNTGSSSTGDTAKVSLPSINTEFFPKIYLRVVLEPTNLGGGKSKASIAMSPNTAGENLTLWLDHPTRSATIDHKTGGTSYLTDTRPGYKSNIVSHEILYDIDQGVLIHRCHDCFGNYVTNNLPIAEDEYSPVLEIITEDTGAERKMYIYNIVWGNMNKFS